MRVALYCCSGSGKRGRHLAEAMRAGLAEHGVSGEILTKFNGVCADVAVAYGWSHERIFAAYKKAGANYIYWDLGYWHRKFVSNPLDGYHRLGVNHWDTAANMRRACPDDRWRQAKFEIKPRQKDGNEILIAGMSEKAARTHGYRFGEWEDKTRKQIAAFKLKYPIVLRPKPNRKQRGLPEIQGALSKARIVISHHSNVAVDALIAGVPSFTDKGVGRLIHANLATELTCDFIEVPYFPREDDRRQLLCDIAYAQWTPAEMRSGAAFEHIRGLLL